MRQDHLEAMASLIIGHLIILVSLKLDQLMDGISLELGHPVHPGQSRAGLMVVNEAGPSDGSVQSGAESVGGNSQLGGKVSNHIHSGTS